MHLIKEKMALNQTREPVLRSVGSWKKIMIKKIGAGGGGNCYDLKDLSHIKLNY